jgi:MFS family permease
MTASRVRPAPVAWLFAMLVIVVSGWVLLPFPRRPTGWEEIAWTIGFGAGFATVGAILVDRRPREPVSRITMAVGLMVVTAVGLRALAVWLEARPGDLPPAGALAAVVSQGLVTLAFLAAGSFLLVRFPNGRERDRLSNAVDALLLLLVVGTVLNALVPGRLDVAWLSAVENPIGIPGLDAEAVRNVGAIVLVAYLVSLVLALAVVVRRYRRSDVVTRAQIRWVVAAAAVPVALAPFLYALEWVWTPWFLSTMLMPVAIGIAILRYRLYDIDRLVGRTLAYAVITAILAAVFVATNLALQAVLAGATGHSTLTIAASTLLVAGLFQPLRHRVQAPIDRRFNRSHLDAARVVAGFAHRTRDEVDLDRLRGAVVSTVSEAVGPSGAVLWLRGVE